MLNVTGLDQTVQTFLFTGENLRILNVYTTVVLCVIPHSTGGRVTEGMWVETVKAISCKREEVAGGERKSCKRMLFF
jgi:hypothetical protein